MYYEKLKCIIKVLAIIILIAVTSIFIINQYIFMAADIRELVPLEKMMLLKVRLKIQLLLFLKIL